MILMPRSAGLPELVPGMLSYPKLSVSFINFPGLHSQQIVHHNALELTELKNYAYSTSLSEMKDSC